MHGRSVDPAEERGSGEEAPLEVSSAFRVAL
jgi:hypothetical protein